jgi:hypothetical protein
VTIDLKEMKQADKAALDKGHAVVIHKKAMAD